MLKSKPAAKRPASKKNVGRITVDIVTGKELISVYFDPEKAIDCSNVDTSWQSENLFSPASVIREDADGVLSVKLVNGEVVKMNGSDAVKITDQDDEGVDDILSLREFSEMSLIHTLRIRYAKDEIYTFVGPILISINPYKRISSLYEEDTMLQFHGKKSVSLVTSMLVSLFALSQSYDVGQ